MLKLKKLFIDHWLTILIFLLGVFFGIFIFFINSSVSKEQFSQTRFKGSYQFINPLVECEDNGQDLINEYIPFETETKERIKEEIIDRNSGVDISVYFRNLNNGPWFGINEDAKFSPASLLKVPIMIAFLKESEDNPSILNKVVPYKKLGEESKIISQNTIINKPLEIGKSYSLETLVEKMIEESDNEATYLLGNNISGEIVDKVYKDLGVTIPDIRISSDYLSVKEYASFFRILYNAAYLEKKTSEKALSILSRSEFHDGLEAGIPEGLKIAHKFGERQIMNKDGSTTKQLHDCGIIYYEEYPYLLCVMTKGNTINNVTTTTLSGIIEDVSRIIYSEISQKYH